MFARAKLIAIRRILGDGARITLGTLRLDGASVAFVVPYGLALSAVGTSERPWFGERYPHVPASPDWQPGRETKHHETAEALAVEILKRHGRTT